MTKIISAENIDIGKVEEFQTGTASGKVNNIGTESVLLSGVVSNSTLFEVGFVAKKVFPPFPASSTIYFRQGFVLQNSNGEFATTPHGYGVAGTTDENRKLTPSYAMSSVTITSPVDEDELALDLLTRVEWTAENVEFVNIIIEGATGIRTINNIDARLGAWVFNLTADSGSFQDGQELTITVECSLNPDCASTVTVDAVTASFTAVEMDKINDVINVADGIHFTIYCEHTGIPVFTAIEIEYSETGDTWEKCGEFLAGSGTTTAHHNLVPEGVALGTGYLRLRVKHTDILSDVLEIEVVEPEIVFDEVIAQVGYGFTYSGTCNLPVNLTIGQAPDPYTDFGLVDTVTVQANGTFSAPSSVGTGGGWRVQALYIQDTVVVFEGQEDFAMSSITNLATSPVSPTENVDFTISCDTNIPDGEEIRFEYSTDQEAWSSLGTGEIISGSAQLTTAKIPTAGSYYVRARYGTSVYSDNLERTVQSGTLLVENWDSYSGNTGVWTGTAGEYTLYTAKNYTSPNCCRLDLSLSNDRYIDSNNLLSSTVDMTGKSVKFRALRWDSRVYSINYEVWLYDSVGTLVGKSTRKTNQAVSDSTWNLMDSGTFTAQSGQVITAVKRIQIYVRSYNAYELPILIDDIIIE